MNLRTFNYKLSNAAEHHQAGRLDIAVRQYKKLLTTNRDHPEVCHRLGLAYYQQNKFADAEALMSSAMLSNPAAPAIWHRRLGLVLTALGDWTGAKSAYATAAKMDNDAQDWRLLAQACQAMGDPLEALKHLRKGVEVSPTEALGWAELGFAYQTIGRYSEAGQCHAESIKLEPKGLPQRLGYGQVLQQLCQIPEAIAEYHKILADHPDLGYAKSHILVASNYLEPSGDELARQHRVYGQEISVKTPRAIPVTHGPKLKVSILSPDLRAHSCAYFLEPLLDFLPSGIEVSLYYDHLVADSTTTRLANKVGQRLQQVAHLGNRELEQKMVADKSGVVIDLAGHFSRNRMELFANRVAPVQVAYLGYPNTTGVAGMDYRLADPRVDLPEHQTHFTETLAFCPGGLWAYRPIEGAPVPGGVPATPRFGYFGMLSKLSPQCLRVWAKLANQSGAPLLIKGDGLEREDLSAYWSAKLLAAGFEPGLFELRPKTASTLDHLKMYEDVTVALDPWPYNGTTTVCEALWQGVPTLALAGDRHASRVATGLLSGAGLGHLAAAFESDYVQIGCDLVKSAIRLDRTELQKAVWMKPEIVADGIWSTIKKLAGA